MDNIVEVKAQKDHCMLAWDTLISYLNSTELPNWPDNLTDHSCPQFVTWYKGQSEDLRGCIGTFASAPLSQNLIKYSIISGFKDERFPPIKSTELKKLTVGLSFLHSFNKIEDPMDWKVGTHGIEIDFQDYSGRNYRGTFLPEVAEEQGWSEIETLTALIRKGGFKGKLEEVINNMNVRTYQSSKIKMSYITYDELSKKKDPNF